ncbi:Endopolyphosphatase [Periconia macrospinosa]|uniref:Endopolyphosphatase n=1 Tax=Periconia macrospinosa TaxID=97972 RepID=A0A2V1DL36_9PLEO|nr:Endopolyphosphatase [Periconia macrospinosa]
MRKAFLWGLAYCGSGWGVAAAPNQDAANHRLDAARDTAGTIRDHHSTTQSQSPPSKPLHGRFLHITDFHPDPFFKTYSSTEHDAACHRKRGPAGYYGAETSACDSPLSLVNATMEWVKHHVADDIDFIIWTGDSARHDNDDKHPRTRNQIIKQNEFMVHKFVEVFGTKKGHAGEAFRIPIVPTFGNNDIMPHNILLQGPNDWTKKYLDIWRGMIPEAQRHQFQQGGWYWVEVIPGKLAVVSLNTMYFFSSNTGVDGCANKHEPGYEQFEWLRVQLQIMRDRGVAAILIGHVPPAHVDSKESWEETCWQKYALWERQYRDVIVASLFGHMNIDHFMLQDFKQITKDAKNGKMTGKRVKGKKAKRKEAGAVELLKDGEVTVASAADYLLDLKKRWAKLPTPHLKKSPQSNADLDEFSDENEVDEDEEETLSTWQRVFSNPLSKSKKGRGKKGGKKKHNKSKSYLDKIGGEYAERYSVTLVSPSVVPNYFPTIRIFTYNTTGLDDSDSSNLPATPGLPPQAPLLPVLPPEAITGLEDEDLDNDAAYLRYVDAAVKRKKKQKEKDSKKQRKYKFKVPAGPSKSSAPGPAYSAQPLTLLGYTQYFANLTRINNDFVAAAPSSSTDEHTPNTESPLTIFGLALSPSSSSSASSPPSTIEPLGWKEGKHHKHQGKKPRPKPHPIDFTFEVEYDTRNDTKYGLTDLTVREWLGLARRIGGKKTSSVRDLESVEEMRKKKKVKEPWATFVQRAFVGSMDPREIEQVFGAGGAPPMGMDGEEYEDDEEDRADGDDEDEYEDEDLEDEDEDEDEEEEVMEL